MAERASLLARVGTLLGRRRSQPIPSADFHFDLGLAPRPAYR